MKYKVRLAQAHLESGDRESARDLVSEVQAWLDRGRKLDDQYGAILQRVQDALRE
jgi:Tfp pilus assembly protein FimV